MAGKSYSEASFREFMRQCVVLGLHNPATLRSRKLAAQQLLTELKSHERNDLRLVDLDETTVIQPGYGDSGRQSMERPEAQDSGTIILTGFDPERVIDSINLVIAEHKKRKYPHIPEDYTITNTSWRVLKLIQGNAGLSNIWHGIK